MTLRRLFESIGSKLKWLAVVLTMLFLVIPPVLIVLTSMEPGMIMVFPTTGLSLHWYVYFINTAPLMEALRTSIVLASLATVFSLLIGVPCAYAIVRYDFKGKQFLSTLFVSPLSLPSIVFGVSLLTYFNMVGFYFTFGKLLVAHVILVIPYVLRTTMAAFIGLDVSLEDAAKNLGADEIQTFGKITLPLIKPGLIAGGVFAFATSFDDLGVAIFLSDYKTYTLPVTLFAFMKSSFSPAIAAVSSVLLIITFAVIVVIEKTMGVDKFTGI
jgi:putative spermidine/putrescine transport system permease protein